MPEHTSSIADLCKSCKRAGHHEATSNANPLKQFEQWLDEAMVSEVPKPNALTLATVASNLRSFTRWALIRAHATTAPGGCSRPLPCNGPHAKRASTRPAQDQLQGEAPLI